jgi:hypothetical protein
VYNVRKNDYTTCSSYIFFLRSLQQLTYTHSYLINDENQFKEIQLSRSSIFNFNHLQVHDVLRFHHKISNILTYLYSIGWLCSSPNYTEFCPDWHILWHDCASGSAARFLDTSFWRSFETFEIPHWSSSEATLLCS